MIPCQRDCFEIPADISYLNCAYLSPQLKSVKEAGFAGVSRKCHPWEVLPAHFFEDAEQARSLFAALISANSDDVALTPSCSYGIAIAAINLQLGAGGNIVVLHEQFPSNIYAWLEAASSTGARVKTVKRQGDESWADAILSAIDRNTRVVSVPNVHWADGSLIDVEVVAERCRQINAELVLDLTQSLGALPFSVEEIRPAFVACAAYKWLLGPYSSAFLYARPDYHQGRAIENNWLNRKGSEQFSDLVNYVSDFQPGARRFDAGERSNFVLLPMVIAALKNIQEWTVPAIQETISAKTDYLSEQALALGLEVLPRSKRAGHILGIRFPSGVPAGLTDALAENKIFVSLRGSAVRVAPHIYNNERDLDRFVRVLKSALS